MTLQARLSFLLLLPHTHTHSGSYTLVDDCTEWYSSSCFFSLHRNSSTVRHSSPSPSKIGLDACSFPLVSWLATAPAAWNHAIFYTVWMNAHTYLGLYAQSSLLCECVERLRENEIYHSPDVDWYWCAFVGKKKTQRRHKIHHRVRNVIYP